MKTFLLVVLLTLSPCVLFAYDSGLINLKSPTDLENSNGEIAIRHRFYGELEDEPLDTFFGMDSGANVGLGFRYVVLPNLELNVMRVRSGQEITLGAGYSVKFPQIPIQWQADVQFFRYEEFSLESNEIEQENGIFGSLSIQTDPILSRIRPVASFGYDSKEENFGVGVGLAVAVLEDLGIVKGISVISEYFPTVREGEYDQSMAFGVRIRTYGHNFDLAAGNNTGIGVRRVMSGAPRDSGMRFGFNIKRRI